MTWLGDHWLDILGWGGSALLVFSLLQSRVLRFRTLNLVASIVLVAFNAALGVWPMVAMNAVLALINVWFIVRLLSEAHDEKVFEVLEVRPDDSYLAHVLKVHGADIRRFQPDWDRVEAEDHPLLVQHGDETVGVVVVRPDGDVARVRLDYVTPRFRDFTPGEFVWRHSTVLRDRGFRRVVTSPQMVGDYYRHLGFRAEGSEFVLDLETAA